MKATLRTRADIDRLNHALLGQELPLQVDFRPYKSQRSVEQNSRYWKILTLIKEHVYETIGRTDTEEELHDFFREKFLPSSIKVIGGIDIKKLTSTTKLNTKDMTDYMEKIDRFCIEKLSYLIPSEET